jgi:integration host factor subunit beta
MSNQKSINKQDLYDQIQRINPSVSYEDIVKCVDKFFDEIATALVCGDRVELRGFGSMTVRKRNSTSARNPKTNESMIVGNKGSLYFRASKELVNNLNAHNDN